MSTKTQQLQIRVTPAQKTILKRRARQAGQDVSSYVLDRILPESRDEFETILAGIRVASTTGGDHRFSLASLNDFLSALLPDEVSAATAEANVRDLPPFLRNYVAAMVEQTASSAGVDPPGWVTDVTPLDEPYFATPLPGLRAHLLKESPVPFKRRNLFVDSTVGDRI